MMKVCIMCGLEKQDGDFNKDRSRKSGLDIYCKACRKIYLKDKKKAYRESYRAKYRSKHRAHNAVYRAKKRGDLVEPETCEVCDNPPSHAHHDDYTKPLDIRWLCNSCHSEWHNNNSPIDFTAGCGNG